MNHSPPPACGGEGLRVGAFMRTDRETDKRVDRARRFRANPTDAERKLWQYLRQFPTNSVHFRRQATIGPYFADFACHTSKLVVELDGGQHTPERDTTRTAYLQAQGYRVLRFWNNDVLGNIDGIMEVIAAALEKSPPPPTPPRRKGVGRGAQQSQCSDNFHSGNFSERNAAASPSPASKASGGEGSGVGGNPNTKSGRYFAAKSRDG